MRGNKKKSLMQYVIFSNINVVPRYVEKRCRIRIPGGSLRKETPTFLRGGVASLGRPACSCLTSVWICSCVTSVFGLWLWLARRVGEREGGSRTTKKGGKGGDELQGNQTTKQNMHQFLLSQKEKPASIIANISWYTYIYCIFCYYIYCKISNVTERFHYKLVRVLQNYGTYE